MERRRTSLASGGRESDIRLRTLAADDTENTFLFTVPPRDVPDPESSDNVPYSHAADEDENTDFGEIDFLSDHEPITSYNLNEAEADISILETTGHGMDSSTVPVPRTFKKKKVKISKHGIPYPSLPAGVVKKLATQFARTSGGSKNKISKDTLSAIMQASDWFFEQISDDLRAYSQHAGRKTIDESDIVTLMKRYALLDDPRHSRASF